MSTATVTRALSVQQLQELVIALAADEATWAPHVRHDAAQRGVSLLMRDERMFTMCATHSVMLLGHRARIVVWQRCTATPCSQPGSEPVIFRAFPASARKHSCAASCASWGLPRIRRQVP